MDITVHVSLLPQADPDAALAFHRDTLGLEVRDDVGYHGMRARLQAGAAEADQEPAGQPYRVRDRAVRDPAGP